MISRFLILVPSFTKKHFYTLHNFFDNAYLIQKQPSCKKVCRTQEGHYEKSEIQGGTKNGCDGKLRNSKNFNNDNSAEFVLPSHVSL